MLEAMAVLALIGAAKASPPARVEVNITQKYLVPVCLDGRKITARERRWRLETRLHAVSFTMGDDPAKAGFPTVRFTPEVGHKYEIEVRAAPITFARRAWERGAWKPVVRDRTADRIVTGEPEWSDSACPSGETPAPAHP
jgi:hypothetical protein